MRGPAVDANSPPQNPLRGHHSLKTGRFCNHCSFGLHSLFQKLHNAAKSMFFVHGRQQYRGGLRLKPGIAHGLECVHHGRQSAFGIAAPAAVQEVVFPERPERFNAHAELGGRVQVSLQDQLPLPGPPRERRHDVRAAIENRLVGEGDGIPLEVVSDDVCRMLNALGDYDYRPATEAGINADDNSLSFDLRQQGQQPGADQSYNGAGQTTGVSASANANDYLSAKIAVEAMGYIRQDGVNIMV